MCFEEATKVPTKTPVVGSGTPPVSKSTKGSIYEKTDIGAYQKKVEDTVKKYSSLGAKQKTSAVAPEFVGVKGAVSIPAAASYGDAKTSLGEVAAKAGDLASAAKGQNIELCGFLSDLPSIDFDMSLPQAGIPALQDLMKEINGISMPVLEFGAEAITNVIGGATKAIGDLASAIQSSVPNITCGATPPLLPVTPPDFASALIPGSPPGTAPIPTVLPVGITPPISVTSPDVTVQSLNDVLEAGEF